MDKEKNHIENNLEEEIERPVIGIKKEISDDELNDQLYKFINSDKEEDSNMVQIIRNMQEYNEKKHEYIEKKQKDDISC
ncbi:MAG: hypothetical protein ACI4TF_09740 [Oliverpabstia sp.]